LSKAGTRVVSHLRYADFQKVEFAIAESWFAEILQMIPALRPELTQRLRRAIVRPAFGTK